MNHIKFNVVPIRGNENNYRVQAWLRMRRVPVDVCWDCSATYRGKVIRLKQ